jgi:hypothetical protein
MDGVGHFLCRGEKEKGLCPQLLLFKPQDEQELCPCAWNLIVLVYRVGETGDLSRLWSSS